MRARVILAFLAACQLFSSALAEDPVCALSEKQEHDAPAAFDKLMPLFQTPRCFNCHGGINMFAGIVTSDGGFIANSTLRGTHPQLDNNENKVVIDPDGNEDVQRTFAACVTCHDAGAFKAGTWRLAPFDPDKRFSISNSGILKAPLDLCKQIKIQGKVPGAAGFIGHMTNDNGDADSPFLATAFAGDFALDPEQFDRAKDDLKNQGGYPAPITVMTRSQAVELTKEWVGDMGGKFRLPDDCGCKEHHYALRVIAHGLLQLPGFTFTVRFDGQGTAFPEIPLKFKDDGSLSGEVMAIPMTDNQGSFPIVSCSGERVSEIKVAVKGSWADITPPSEEPTFDLPAPPKNPIRIKLTLGQVQTSAGETCSTPYGAVFGSSDKTGPPEYTFELIFADPHVNQAEGVPWPAPFPGWSGAVRGQIIEVGGKGSP